LSRPSPSDEMWLLRSKMRESKRFSRECRLARAGRHHVFYCVLRKFQRMKLSRDATRRDATSRDETRCDATSRDAAPNFTIQKRVLFNCRATSCDATRRRTTRHDATRRRTTSRDVKMTFHGTFCDVEAVLAMPGARRHDLNSSCIPGSSIENCMPSRLS